jgi:tetratricopeptide (TPR) repeat protein
MGELRYVEALALYTESYALEPKPALLYNRGRALVALARFPEALTQIERFAREAPPDLKKRVPQLDELIESLRQNVCTLRLDVSVDGARILLGNEQIAESPVRRPLPVNAGRAVLEVVAEGYKPYKKPVALPGAGELSLEIDLEPLSGAATRPGGMLPRPGERATPGAAVGAPDSSCAREIR